MNKKKQHYVWRNYLNSWTVNDQLFCQRSGKIFSSNAEGVAVENYFYHTKELNQDDFNLIEEFVLKPASPFHKILHRNWLKAFNMPFRQLTSLKELGFEEEKIEKFRTWLENNIYEELLSEYEGGWNKFLSELQCGKMDFFSDNSERMGFLFFLAVQYMRTDRMKNAVSQSVAKTMKKDGFDLEKIWNPVSHIFAVNVAFDTYNKKPKLCMLENESSVPFITGDQPVVNISATNIPPGQPSDKMELYYPVTPKLAVLLTENETCQTNKVSVSSEEAACYNDHIFQNSNNSIYAQTKEILEQFQSRNVETKSEN